MIEIRAVGGYNEIGKNMTAIRINGDVVIIDMGLHLEHYIAYTQDEDIVKLSAAELTKVGAVPNLSTIKDWIDDVRVIVPTHAHLDHVGALPFLANNFKAPILCTPFTAEVLQTILRDEKIKINNPIKSMNSNATYQISENLSVEFINMTHSVPQTVMVALHTPQGIILYANDFKFDSYPTLGKKPNFNRLKEIGSNCLALIVDCTNATEAIKTPSEQVAKDMLKDVLIGTESEGKAIVVTTFSSHLARLKSIVEFGKQLNRKIIFLGRSLHKYTVAGEKVGIINFTKDVEIAKRGKHMRRLLDEVQKKPGKYLVVVTGHQGEPRSVLSRMASGELPFDFKFGDHIVFSCTVIPTKTSIDNRIALEKSLSGKGLRIFKEIHVSGHAAREDLRDLLTMVKPKHILPAHGDSTMTAALAKLAVELGYKRGKEIHIMRDGQKTIL